MAFFKGLAAIFLFPGTLMLNALGVSVEQDGGILRSFVNMIFWGIVLIPIVFALALT